jgi:hypothetical protein
MRRLFRPVLPVLLGFAWRHRDEVIDWAKWTYRNLPRVVEGEGREVFEEAKARIQSPPTPARSAA